MLRRSLLLVTASCLLYSGSAASQELIQLYENSVSRQPYVTFNARDGSPGHAFVILGEELDNALTFQLGVFGFYPKDGKKLVIRALFGTDGVIDQKWADLESDVRFRQNISPAQKANVSKILNEWKTKKYSLLDNNCNKLAEQVAIAIGLKAPSAGPGTTFPVNYIEALESVNK